MTKKFKKFRSFAVAVAKEPRDAGRLLAIGAVVLFAVVFAPRKEE